MAFSIYNDEVNRDNLYQGDLIRCTDDVYEAIFQSLCMANQGSFGEVKPDYLAVITQSCDLKEYKGKWKTDFVTIAFAFKLDHYVSKLVQNVANKQSDEQFLPHKILNSLHKQKIDNELQNIINYRVHEYFLYHDDLVFEAKPDRLVALHYLINLRETYPIPIAAIYNLLLQNKIAQLKDSFRDKLGYNVSYLFSRVGVDEPDKSFVEGIRKSMLSSYETADKEKIEKIEKNSNLLKQFQAMLTQKELLDFIDSIHIPKAREILETVLLKELKAEMQIPEEKLQKLVKTIINNQEIRSLLNPR